MNAPEDVRVTLSEIRDEMIKAAQKDLKIKREGEKAKGKPISEKKNMRESQKEKGSPLRKTPLEFQRKELGLFCGEVPKKFR